MAKAYRKNSAAGTVPGMKHKRRNKKRNGVEKMAAMDAVTKMMKKGFGSRK
jgi:hypothetical protein